MVSAVSRRGCWRWVDGVDVRGGDGCVGGGTYEVWIYVFDVVVHDLWTEHV